VTDLRAGLQGSLGVEFGEVDSNGQTDIVGMDATVLVEFSTPGVDIESEVEQSVSDFTEQEGRTPTSAEVGKAHKTITLALQQRAVSNDSPVDHAPKDSNAETR